MSLPGWTAPPAAGIWGSPAPYQLPIPFPLKQTLTWPGGCPLCPVCSWDTRADLAVLLSGNLSGSMKHLELCRKSPQKCKGLVLFQVLGTEVAMLDPVMGAACWAGLAPVGSVSPRVCGVSRISIHFHPSFSVLRLSRCFALIEAKGFYL